MENLQGKEGIYASLDLSKKGRITVHDLGLTLLPGSQIQTEGGHQGEGINPSEQNVASGEEQGERVVHDASRTAGETQNALALAPCRKVQPRDLARSDVGGHAVLDRNTLKRKGGPGPQIQTEGGHEVEEEDPSEQNIASGEEQGERAGHDASRTAGETQIALALAPCRNVQPRDLARSNVGGHAVLDRNTLKRKGGPGSQIQTEGGHEVEEVDPSEQNVASGEEQGEIAGHDASRAAGETQIALALAPCKNVQPRDLARSDVGGHAVLDRNTLKRKVGDGRKGAAETTYSSGGDEGDLGDDESNEPRGNWTRKVPQPQKRRRLTKDVVPGGGAAGSGGCQRLSRMWRMKGGKRTSLLNGVQGNTSLRNQPQPPAFPPPESVLVSSRHGRSTGVYVSDNSTDSGTSTFTSESGLKVRTTLQRAPVAQKASIFPNSQPKASFEPFESFVRSRATGNCQKYSQQVSRVATATETRYRTHRSRPAPAKALAPTDPASYSILTASVLQHPIKPKASFEPFESFVRSPITENRRGYSRQVSRAATTPERPYRSHRSRPAPAKALAPTDPASYSNPTASGLQHPIYSTAPGLDFVLNPGVEQLQNREQHLLSPDRETSSASQSPEYTQALVEANDRSGLRASSSPMSSSHRYQSQGSTDPYAANDNTFYANVYQSQGSSNSYAANDNTSYPNFGQSQGRANQYAASNNIVDANYGQSQGNANPDVERVRPTDASSHANLSSMGPAHEQTPWLSIADANTPLEAPVPHSNVTRPSQAPHASTSSKKQLLTSPYVDAILIKICSEMDLRRSDENEIYELMLKLVQTFPVSGQRSVPAGQYYSYVVAEKLKELKARVTEADAEMTRLKDEAAWKGQETLLLKQQIDQLWQKNQRLEELLRLRSLPQVKPAAAVIGDQERRTASLPSATFVHWNPQATIDLTGEDTAPAPAVPPKRKAAAWLEGYNPLNKHPRLSLHGEPTPHEQHLQREPQAGAISGSDGGQSEVARKKALKDAANARRRARRAEEKRKREEEGRAVEVEERAGAEGEAEERAEDAGGAERGGVEWVGWVRTDGGGEGAEGEEVAGGEEFVWGEEDAEGETDEEDLIAAEFEEAWARQEEADAAEEDLITAEFEEAWARQEEVDAAEGGM